MAKSIDTKDVAKMIRKALATAFPAVKFSVRLSRYAGGSSVDIGWTDGPTVAMVDHLAGKFQGRGFDGSIDMAYYISHWLAPDGSITVANSEGTACSRGSVPPVHNPPHHPRAIEVNFGSSHVGTRREFTRGMYDRSLSKVKARWHFGEVNEAVQAAEYQTSTRTFGKETFTSHSLAADVYVPGHNCYLSDLVYRDMRKRCAGNVAQPA